MKILRLIGSMDPASGGPCQGIRNSVPELNKYGIHNEVVSLDSPDCPFLGSDSFPVHALGPGTTSWLYSPKLIPWLFENLFRFHAVIVHGLWNYHAYAIRWVYDQLKKKGEVDVPPKLMVMPHGMLDPYFQRASGRELKAIRNWIYWKLLEHRLIEKADAVLFTCEQELVLARQTFRPYQPRLEINVGYGIADPPVYDSDHVNEFYQFNPGLKGRPYILFLSRIHEKKGVDLLLSAFQRKLWNLRNQPDLIEPGITPDLVIAGPGLDTDFGKKLMKFVETDSGLRAKVHFTGMLTGRAKWGALYACEAFVLPSHQENFGISVVEALACGKPVLITDQVNIWREIAEHQAGLVESDNYEGITLLLDRWFSLSMIQRQEMGINAHRCYRQHFTVGAAVKNLKDFIGTIT